MNQVILNLILALCGIREECITDIVKAEPQTTKQVVIYYESWEDTSPSQKLADAIKACPGKGDEKQKCLGKYPGVVNSNTNKNSNENENTQITVVAPIVAPVPIKPITEEPQVMPHKF